MSWIRTRPSALTVLPIHASIIPHALVAAASFGHDSARELDPRVVEQSLSQPSHSPLQALSKPSQSPLTASGMMNHLKPLQIPENPYAPVPAVACSAVPGDSGTDIPRDKAVDDTSVNKALPSFEGHTSSTLHLRQISASSLTESGEMRPALTSCEAGDASVSDVTIHSSAAPTMNAAASEDSNKHNITTSDSGEAALHKDTIPAFIPVVAVKREQHSETPTPLRDMSAPLPTTESTPSESRGTKRPISASTTKRGTAKRAPPAKRQKVEGTAAGAAKPNKKSNARSRKAASLLNSSPAPHSSRGVSSVARSSQSPGADGNGDIEDQVEDEDMASPDPESEVYCICRKPDTGTFMIGCDGGCDDWFHGKCVGIADRDRGLIDRYMCPRCVENGKKDGKEVITTWKRMCRRPGCRLPARLGKKGKKEEEPSKYCSDACGVDFFREVMDRTRGSFDSGPKTSARRKTRVNAQDHDNFDPGPQGGTLNRGELKALVHSVSTFEAFKRLGDGVLSPPPTPPPSGVKAGADNEERSSTSQLNEAEQRIMEEISMKKDELRVRHGLLKDQSKFINMLRQTGERTAEAKGLKAKDLCGYDGRAQWEEETFAVWRASTDGQAVLKSGVLQVKTEDGEQDETADGGVCATLLTTTMTKTTTTTTTTTTTGPCMKRKCAKHFDWSKLALETNRFETSENSERMRALEREERDLRERAGLRARQLKTGEVGGTVERHDLAMLREGIIGSGSGGGSYSSGSAEATPAPAAPAAPALAAIVHNVVEADAIAVVHDDCTGVDAMDVDET